MQSGVSFLWEQTTTAGYLGHNIASGQYEKGFFWVIKVAVLSKKGHNSDKPIISSLILPFFES